jgi:lysine 6-dehydrogenase
MKVAITGGAGRQALGAAYDFIDRPDVEKILLIDVNDKALDIRKRKLNSEKVETAVIDLSDTNKLAAALKDCAVVLNGASYAFNLLVMDACEESKTNYTDFGGFFYWTQKQMARCEDWKKAGITGIVGSGSAPGITNALAKYGTDRLDTVEEVILLDAIHNPGASALKMKPPYSLETIIEEFTHNNFEWDGDDWKELTPPSGKLTLDLPAPYGTRNFFNTLHSEVGSLPLTFKERGLKKAAFKLSLPEIFEERINFLMANGMGRTDKINVKGVEVSPRDVLKELFEVHNDVEESENPNAVFADAKWLRADVVGYKDGQRVKFEVGTDMRVYRYGITNGLYSVGMPGAVTAWILGSGIIKEKGFYSTEGIIPTDIFFAQLKERGVTAYCNRRIEEI